MLRGAKTSAPKQSTARSAGPAAAKTSKSRANGRGKAPARRAVSLVDEAYEAIKRDIITCALRPGEYLNERHLCERLGIGRTPVHQAISQLQQEHFIDVIPRKGIIVRPASIDEYLNLDEARLLVEVEAMRIVAKRITPDELAELEEILERGRAAREARNLAELLMIDRDFHFGLARATRNPVLIGMLESAYERSLRVWFISLVDQNIDSDRDEHERLLAAIRAGDGDGAAAIMREHILSSRAYTMRQS